MKRSEYCNIASYKELRMVKRENYKALKRKRNELRVQATQLAASLSPKALLEKMLGYISPLEALFRIFSRG
jgi:hypothetical protein